MSLDSPAGRAVIEAGAVKLRRSVDRGYVNARLEVEVVLTAALAVRVPCETCGGSGWVEYALGKLVPGIAPGDDPPGPPGRPRSLCSPCGGSGTVSALRVLLDEEGT